MEQQLEHRLTKLEIAVEPIPEIVRTLQEINTKFAKYEGRWGMFTLIGTGLWIALTTFKDDLINWLRN